MKSLCHSRCMEIYLIFVAGLSKNHIFCRYLVRTNITSKIFMTNDKHDVKEKSTAGEKDGQAK